jgi:hypothetical protein
MTRTAEAPKRKKRPSASPGSFHQELIKAKRDQCQVRIELAFESEHTRSDGFTIAEVCLVDDAATKFKIEGREVWFLEAFLCSVEILPKVSA